MNSLLKKQSVSSFGTQPIEHQLLQMMLKKPKYKELAKMYGKMTPEHPEKTTEPTLHLGSLLKGIEDSGGDTHSDQGISNVVILTGHGSSPVISQLTPETPKVLADVTPNNAFSRDPQ